MAMDVSRYEINRLVRTVLTRHSADLTLVDSSSIGSTVYVSGSLKKISGEDFVPGAIDELAKELNRIAGVRDVQFDFSNWFLSGVQGSWQLRKGKDRHGSEQYARPNVPGAVSTATTVEINKSEMIADVLEDLKEKEKESNQGSAKLGRL